MVSLVFEIVNGRCFISSAFSFMNPKGPPSHAVVVLARQERKRVDPFPSGDPARAAVELVNSMREQEHGQLEVQVTIGVVLKDELRYT